MPVWGLNMLLALQPRRGVGWLWTRLSNLDPSPPATHPSGAKDRCNHAPQNRRESHVRGLHPPSPAAPSLPAERQEHGDKGEELEIARVQGHPSTPPLLPLTPKPAGSPLPSLRRIPDPLRLLCGRRTTRGDDRSSQKRTSKGRAGLQRMFARTKWPQQVGRGSRTPNPSAARRTPINAAGREGGCGV